VAHFISGPAATKEGREFEADVGSSPVEAFEGFLDAKVALGVRRLVGGGLD